MNCTILIGSSPIIMLEALYLSKKGEKVVILEKNEQLGGAWKTFHHKSYANIELGCHIWEYNKKTYQFIENNIGVHLTKINPEPLLIKEKVKLHYNRKELLVITLRAIKHLKDLNLTDLWFEGIYFLKNKLYFKKVDYYYYATNGCQELTSKLIKKIKGDNNISIVNSEVKQINYNNNSINVITEKENLNCKKVKLPSNFDLAILINGTELKLKVGFNKEINHFFIICNKADVLSEFSYLRFIKHPIFHRVSNATFKEFQQQFPDKSLLIAGVLPKVAQQKGIEQTILAELKKYNLYDGIPEEQFWVQYKSKEFENRELRLIQKKSNNKISYIDTGCLSNGIYKQLHRWGDLKV